MSAAWEEAIRRVEALGRAQGLRMRGRGNVVTLRLPLPPLRQPTHREALLNAALQLRAAVIASATRRTV